MMKRSAVVFLLYEITTYDKGSQAHIASFLKVGGPLVFLTCMSLHNKGEVEDQWKPKHAN